jgi:hypothetical protein
MIDEPKPRDRHSPGTIDRTQTPRRIDEPEPCFVRLRLVSDGVWLAARIFERLGTLAAEINGREADPHQVWHAGNLISEEQYWFMLRDGPEPNPFRRVKLSTAGLDERIREQNEQDWWDQQPIKWNARDARWRGVVNIEEHDPELTPAPATDDRGGGGDDASFEKIGGAD